MVKPESKDFQCPVCHSKRNKLILSHGVDYEYGVKGNFRFYECLRCGLISLWPRPSLGKIKSFYPPSYHSYQRPSSFLFKFLSSINLNKRKKNYGRLIGNSGKILDVGCGDGEIMEALEARGDYDCYGVEFKKEIVKLGRKKGLRIYYGTLEKTRELKKSFFDLLIMNHLIEHLENPYLVLKRASELLREGGWISGETPNARCLEKKLFGAKWSGYHVPRHLQIFSASNLTRLLRKAGFTRVVIKKSPNPGQWALSWQNLFLSYFPKTKRVNGKIWLYPLFLAISVPTVILENWFLSESSILYVEARK